MVCLHKGKHFSIRFNPRAPSTSDRFVLASFRQGTLCCATEHLIMETFFIMQYICTKSILPHRSGRLVNFWWLHKNLSTKQIWKAKCWICKVEMQTLSTLFRALDLSSSLPHAGDWFNVVPSQPLRPLFPAMPSKDTITTIRSLGQTNRQWSGSPNTSILASYLFKNVTIALSRKKHCHVATLKSNPPTFYWWSSCS